MQANDEICHHCGQCLIQLASLCGEVFQDTLSQTQYISNFMEGFLQISKRYSVCSPSLATTTVTTTLWSLYQVFAMYYIENKKELLK